MKKPQDEQHLQFAVLAVDVLVFTIRDGKILIRLSNVDRPPFFNNVPGFPGGLIRPEETAEETVNRILVEKALISSSDTYIEQFYTFSKVDRDPRGRVVSVGYIAFVPWEKLSDEERLGDTSVWWSEKRNIKNLAYDHSYMLAKAMEYIHTRIKSTTIIFKLLPDRFTLTMVESSLETILEEKLDKRNFRKKIAKTKILKTLKEKTTGMKHRPAQLYSVKSNDVIEASLF